LRFRYFLQFFTSNQDYCFDHFEVKAIFLPLTQVIQTNFGVVRKLSSRKKCQKCFYRALFWCHHLVGNSSSRKTKYIVDFSTCSRRNNTMSNDTSPTRCFFIELTPRPAKYFDSLYLVCLVLHAVSFLPAAIGNGVVTLTTFKTPSLQKPSFVLLSCAAFADSLTGFLAQPVAMASFAAKLKGQFSAACWLDLLKECLGWLFGGISVSILAFLSVERYLALRLGLRYQTVITVKRVLLIVIFFWLALLTLGTFRFFALSNKTYVAIHLPFMLLSLVILTATYCKIHLFIKRHRLKLSPAENQKQNAFDVAKYKKITLAVLYIVCFYWLFFAPFVCVLLAFLLSGFTERVEGAYYITTTLILANAAVNPLLYCWKLRALRQAVLKYIKDILHLHS